MNRWRILTIGCTEVRLHPATIVFLLYTVITGHFIITLLAMFSIILHETAHGVMATICGHSPSCIEITPLGATMRLENDARLSVLKRLLTITAGPVSTFLLCALSLWVTKINLISVNLGGTLFRCNLAILFINLLPFLPLDGGRMFHLILSTFLPSPMVTGMVKAVSYLGGLLLIMINILVSWTHGGWNLSLAFAGCCILYNASIFTVTQAMSELRLFVDRKINLERKGIMHTDTYIAVHTTLLRQLIRMLPANRFAYFYCIETGSQQILGGMHESEIIQHYLSNPADTFVDALLSEGLR